MYLPSVTIPGTDKVLLLFQCSVCGETIQVNVKPREYHAWAIERRLVQDAFPGMTPATRELFISGTCEKCFDRMFKEPDGEAFKEDLTPAEDGLPTAEDGPAGTIESRRLWRELLDDIEKRGENA